MYKLLIRSLGLLLASFTILFVFQSISKHPNSIVFEENNSIKKLLIKPSATDTNIVTTDVEHLVMYDSLVQHNQLLLFLPGTNGIPNKGPMKLFTTAIEEGYKVINLSYINQPSVAKICQGENLAKDAECTRKFRTQRIFGTQLTTLIPDQSHDAIIHRFTKLLLYLKENDRNGNWDHFLKNDKPNWDVITLAGQSQGGGMSAFIAKTIKVNRIITFSGGWDFSKENEIANWYYSASVTPSERWYGIYHTDEPKAKTIHQSYSAMNIPEDHIFPLDKELRKGKKAHGEGIRNIVYKDLWRELLDHSDTD